MVELVALVALVALVRTHPATLHETRQRAALTLDALAAANASPLPLTLPTLDEAMRQLLDG